MDKVPNPIPMLGNYPEGKVCVHSTPVTPLFSFTIHFYTSPCYSEGLKWAKNPIFV